MIAIVDYGVGNIKSVQNMFKKVGAADAVLTDDPKVIEESDKILLPGVGHFDHGMTRLRQSPCFGALNRQALERKVPVLGICLGAQMLTKGSEEGKEPGLGWIEAKTVGFQQSQFSDPLPIPHMGWSEVEAKDHPLFADMEADARFYFVHSFYMMPQREENTLCTAVYGHSFAAGVMQDNIMGVQFHPEKSHKFGMRLLYNFAHL